MDISYLKEFVYLAKSLSFKRTAEHFYVSRSVISRHLSSLEESLGTRLIERSNHTMKLTPTGEVFYRDALIMLHDWATALDHIREMKENASHIVRIGYLRNAARPVIVEFVRYMQQAHPDIRLSMACMEYGDLRRAMDEGAVDIALAVNVHPEVSHNYRSTLIYTDTFSVVMSKDHPKASAQSISIDELPEEKLLIPDSFVYAGLSELIDSMIESKTQLISRAYYSDIDMLYLKVQTEGYVAFSSSLNNDLFGDRLAIVALRDVDSAFTVSAFYRDGLADDLFEACRDGFRHCRDELKDRLA